MAHLHFFKYLTSMILILVLVSLGVSAGFASHISIMMNKTSTYSSFDSTGTKVVTVPNDSSTGETELVISYIIGWVLVGVIFFGSIYNFIRYRRHQHSYKETFDDSIFLILASIGAVVQGSLVLTARHAMKANKDWQYNVQFEKDLLISGIVPIVVGGLSLLLLIYLLIKHTESGGVPVTETKKFDSVLDSGPLYGSRKSLDSGKLLDFGRNIYDTRGGADDYSMFGGF